ncbi:DNA polymerase III subunit beta [candidate division WWE3 bacterium]|jgi:DNA polymerase-3 subunit beta|uniref:Beta sliding clamp n=1 Tax=candidate division WWE3 bacterium TaxID=2053526 RepID=A0A3A4ZCY1_UNCKA|nr:MAG: DNA polymerase III subunit beta [candidate division WWE3 bacterium]
MKFTCLQENLEKGLQIVSRAVPNKGSLPILSNILFVAENGRLKLAATNLETAVTTYVPCSVEEEGSVTIPAKLIKDFVSTLRPGTIKASLNHDVLHITSEKTKSKFNGISADEYPELPVFPEDVSYFELDPKEFGDDVAYVAFASGNDESRPIFTGIFLNYQEGVLTIASTDGFRLSEKILKIESSVGNFSAVIPARTMLEVSKIFAGSQEKIKFALNEGENLALFSSEDTTVATRILDGQYPDYKKIIPSEKVLSASFSTDEFVEAVKLTNVFAKEGNNAIKVRFDPEENLIRISSLAEEAGEHISELGAEIEGDLLEIAFSSRYLLDYLNNIKTERIHFRTNGNISPCLLLSDAHENFIHIIMPMQI